MTVNPTGFHGTPALQPAAAAKPRALLRRYTVQSLAEDGSERISDHMAPATPDFEGAFNAFARGTAIMTADGPRAVEDLRPGQMIETQEFGPQPLLWLGSMMMVPHLDIGRPEQNRLLRITSDRFGPARPGVDLMVGPGARMLRHLDVMREDSTEAQAFVGFRDYLDFENVFEVAPQTPVETYHLCLGRHATILAEGMAVESYHPDHHLAQTMAPNRLQLFLSLFPHIETFDDFGLMAHPRMSLDTVRTLDAA